MSLPSGLPFEVFAIDLEPVAIVVMSRLRWDDDIHLDAVVGRVSMDHGLPAWSTFTASPSFVDLYESFMRGEHEARPRALDEACVNPGELVYVVDGRVPDAGGHVAFADIIGWYESDPSGRPIPSSFQYNRKHALVTSTGASSLIRDPGLRSLVYAEEAS